MIRIRMKNDNFLRGDENFRNEQQFLLLSEWAMITLERKNNLEICEEEKKLLYTTRSSDPSDVIIIRSIHGWMNHESGSKNEVVSWRCCTAAMTWQQTINSLLSKDVLTMQFRHQCMVIKVKMLPSIIMLTNYQIESIHFTTFHLLNRLQQNCT
jgi:hypothetical protein